MSVRARFAATVAAVIAVTVALFATFSILAVDAALRSGFEGRLRTAAQAVATTVDVHHGRIEVDRSDLRELAAIHADTPFAIVAPDGIQIGGNALPAMPRSSGLSMVSVPVMRDGLNAGSVAVWQSNLWIGDFDRDAAIVSFGLGLALVLLGVMLSQRVAKTALRPAERIASLAETIEAHDLGQRLHADSSDELGRLCASFDRMLDRLQEAFVHERRFAADASHELRAPLAVLRAETELALRRPRSAEEYRGALESIAREASRLENLVEELLAAARADVDARERGRVNAADLVRELAHRVGSTAAVRGVRVELATQYPVQVYANRAGLERALLAILHNAVAFADANGRVDVSIDARGPDVRIEVADDGPGFTPQAIEHATERFWRDDLARPRGGTGLGLAIARTLIEANGGRLQLSNARPHGAVVTVVLPSA